MCVWRGRGEGVCVCVAGEGGGCVDYVECTQDECLCCLILLYMNNCIAHFVFL